jgi:hypothetical protein
VACNRLKKDQIAEHGARLTRRDNREYREYLSEEQRRQRDGPARDQPIKPYSGACRVASLPRA